MEITTPQYRIRIIPPCPRCGTRRPWRDGRCGGRQRWRCRACRFTWVERSWREARHRRQETLRIANGKLTVTRRAEAAFRLEAQFRAAVAEAVERHRATLEAALGPFRAAMELGRAVADMVAAVMRFDTSRHVAILQAACPRCKSFETVRDGQTRGKPRRKCKACGCRYAAEARWRRVKPQPSLEP